MHSCGETLIRKGTPKYTQKRSEKLEETIASSKLPRNFGEYFVAFVVVSDYLPYAWED